MFMRRTNGEHYSLLVSISDGTHHQQFDTNIPREKKNLCVKLHKPEYLKIGRGIIFAVLDVLYACDFIMTPIANLIFLDNDVPHTEFRVHKIYQGTNAELKQSQEDGEKNPEKDEDDDDEEVDENGDRIENIEKVGQKR